MVLPKWKESETRPHLHLDLVTSLELLPCREFIQRQAKFLFGMRLKLFPTLLINQNFITTLNTKAHSPQYLSRSINNLWKEVLRRPELNRASSKKLGTWLSIH